MRIKKISTLSNIGTFILTAIYVVYSMWPQRSPQSAQNRSKRRRVTTRSKPQRSPQSAQNPPMPEGESVMKAWIVPSILGLCILVSAILHFMAARMSRGKTEKPEKTSQDQQQLVADIENQKARIKDLERELKNETKKYSHELNQKETVWKQWDSVESELATLRTQYGWLHETADKQANDISDCLEVKVSFCYYTEADHLPRVVFAVKIYNKSVFEINIEPKMKEDEYIEIGGHELRGDKKFIVMPDKILPLSEGDLTLEQRIKSEEVRIVKKCLNDKLGAFFYFNKLDIMVAEGTQFPKVKSVPLKLPEHVRSKDSLDRAKELEKRISNIESLACLLGMLIQATRQYESGQALSQSEVEHLDTVIHQELRKCFDDSQIIENYYYVVKNKPTEVSGQQLWLQNSRAMLTNLIKQERVPN